VADSAELWRVHQNAQFPPSCLGRAVDGVRLVKIDAVAGAILTASLRTDGVPRPLEESKRRDLDRHLVLIRKALEDPGLEAEGRAYFERLALLSDEVLKGSR